MANEPKIISDKEPCMRCNKPITNDFRKEPWCHDCQVEMEQLTFTGAEVFEIILAVMPPLHLKQVSVEQMHTIARRMLIHKGIFPPDPEPEDPPAPSPIILTH